jgi:phosphatidylserine/phosphatidylglycerophosphate/cardiolipin synthase-like enzyme
MLEPHFTNIKGVILSQISQAEKSIYACVAWFTDADLLAALCRRAESGVSVALMIYDDAINGKLDFSQLENSGGKVFKVDEELMHNKFCVIDADVVLTGSPNWTYAANKHDRDENLVVISEEPQFAQKFIEEFQLYGRP